MIFAASLDSSKLYWCQHFKLKSNTSSCHTTWRNLFFFSPFSRQWQKRLNLYCKKYVAFRSIYYALSTMFALKTITESNEQNCCTTEFKNTMTLSKKRDLREMGCIYKENARQLIIHRSANRYKVISRFSIRLLIRQSEVLFIHKYLWSDFKKFMRIYFQY